MAEDLDKVFHSGKDTGEFRIKMQMDDKYEIIRNYISGKNVLDIGCTGGDPDAYTSERWMHGYIKKYSSYVIGLDLNENLIEHLYNPGNFLENVRRHMDRNSHLILVTPNPYRYSRIKDQFIKGYVRNHVDHTCWFDPVTLSQLLDFHGFKVEVIYWTGYTERMVALLGNRIINRLCFKGVLAQDFVVVAKMKT